MNVLHLTDSQEATVQAALRSAATTCAQLAQQAEANTDQPEASRAIAAALRSSEKAYRQLAGELAAGLLHRADA